MGGRERAGWAEDRAGWLFDWPEVIKAIVMATAVHNIEGSTRLSEYDGAGGITADRADDVASGANGGRAGITYSCASPNSLDLTTMSLAANKRFRAVIVWDQNPNYSNYSSEPSVDLDLHVADSNGFEPVGWRSESFDNTYEIVEFTPSSAGNYTLRVKMFGTCHLTPMWLGWAWWQQP